VAWYWGTQPTPDGDGAAFPHARYDPRKTAVVRGDDRLTFLARFQKIDAVRVVDALPQHVAGKTLRRVLQQMYFEERTP